MMNLIISGNEYKVSFGFNSFCDSDLMERVEDIMMILSGAESDKDVSTMGRMRGLFVITRELLYEGFKMYNPVGNLQDIGNLLDTYMKETPRDEEGNPTESRGVLELFVMITNDLMTEGFLPDLMEKLNQAVETANKSSAKTPQDHKKAIKKK